MPQIEIKNRRNDTVIFSGEYADLREALVAAVKSGANLDGANLYGAENFPDATHPAWRGIKHDFFAVLHFAQPEIAGLRQALMNGTVDGSCYQGECACLVGTICKLRQIDFDAVEDAPELLPGIVPDADSPIERFFLGIKEGDTPENSKLAALAVAWIDEFMSVYASPEPVSA